MATRRIDESGIVVLREGSPDWIEVGFGAVWVADYADDRKEIVRIDPETNAVTARVPVPIGSCQSMGIGEGGVWVPDGAARSLVRIDPATNAIAGTYRVDVTEDGEGSVGVGAGSVWVVVDEGTRAGRVARVDAKTGAITASIRVPDDSHGVRFGFGAVWISSTANGSVTRVDPATNTVAAEIRVGASPRFLDVGESAVWVLNQSDGTVSRIDPATDEVVATIAAGAPGTGGDIAAGAGAVWVRGAPALLTRIDARTNAVTDRFGPPLGSGAVRVSGTDVWLSAHDVHRVWRLRTAP